MSRSTRLPLKDLPMWLMPTWLMAGALATLLALGCGGASGTPSNPGGNPQGASANLQLASKASLGSYLVSAAGLTLYYFGLDVPGTASAAPVANCTTAEGCLVAWPIFHVDTPMVASGLDASDFTSFTRSDGTEQTAFRGWPLYLYAGDAQAGDTNGDDFEVWYVIRIPFYSALVMTKATGPALYLADPQGRAVYVFADDTVGTATAAPVSACTGACLSTWPIFLADGTTTPTGVDASKLTTFIRPDGSSQSAFDGHPLYYYSSDVQPGQTNGEGFMGVWKTVDPTTL
ncbi:MAG: hypothetical protein ACLQDQ_10625 [Myxococcaceae bacterium]